MHEVNIEMIYIPQAKDFILNNIKKVTLTFLNFLIFLVEHFITELYSF